MLKKHLILLLLFALLSTILFTGCRTKDPIERKDYTGIELTYYKVFDDEDVMEPLIAQYIIDHPGLKINYKKFSDFSEYQSVLLNEMAEGEGPDIFSMQNTWFTSNYKKVEPMPKEFGTSVDFEETFVDVAYKDLVRTDEDGYEQIYGLPMTVDTLALYYNKEHFEDRIPERGKPAATWEGIKEDMSLLTKEDASFDRFEVSGIAMGRSDNISRAVDILYLLFLQYGVEFYDELMSEAVFAGARGAGNYPAMEALKLYTSFADEEQKHYSWNEFVVDDNSLSREVEAFVRGDVSMIIGYSYTYENILNEINLQKGWGNKTIADDVIRIAPIPQLYDPEVSKDKRIAYASYFSESVSRNSEHPDIAWDFLIYLTSEKNLEYYFNETRKPTSRRNMIDAQKKHPIYGVFASQIGYAESFSIIDYYRYKEIFEEVIHDANNGILTVTRIGEAQDLIDELLPSGGIIVPKVEKPEEED